MNRTLKWAIGTLAGIGILGLLIFAFIQGRAELESERQKEEPIKVPPRISKSAEGELIVTLDRETQERIGLQTVVLSKQSVFPETIAYGRIQEDPSSSFVVHAPISGVLIAEASRSWPVLGETLSDGLSIGSVEPRLGPSDKLSLATEGVGLTARISELTTRISDAQADTEAADARLSAARAEYERLRTLNADNKNVSDRAVQDSEAVVKTEEARLAAARRNLTELRRDATELQAASQRLSAGTTSIPVPLNVTRGGEVVELLARPSEAVEGGQSILRVTRFDHVLARVDVPVGDAVDRSSLTSARIVVLGHEDHPLTGTFVSLASSVDPATLSEGFVFRLSGPDSLRPGTPIIAYLRAPGTARSGVLVPDSAVLRSAGKTWVYRQLADDKFSKLEIPVDHMTGNGFLVLQVLKPGDRIVVRGGQLLLSEEQKSQIEILEESK